MVKSLKTCRGKTKILIVEDHAMVREALAQAIDREADLNIWGQAADPKAALEFIETSMPDMVMTALALKTADGLDLIKDIGLRYPKLPVLAFSMHDDVSFAERALRSGARGYITKYETLGNLIEAIRTVLSGGVYLNPSMASQIAVHMVGQSRPSTGLSVDKLSDRELQIFQLIGQGCGTSEICRQLHLVSSTVETYRARLREKLALSSARELLRVAITWTHGSTPPGAATAGDTSSE